jgi:NAD(P)-dependent dehydrogenase (short-subunit alcohol dehydrogenase family)
MSQVYLITGASTGFGAIAARALATTKAHHVIFAGMYSHSGSTQQYEEDIVAFNKSHNADIRPVALNLLDKDSCDAAVQHVLHSTGGKLDVIIHNAGHMNYGPAESFTPEQYLRLYDVNVVGAHRLNQAVLPHLRKQRSGHLIWISSSSVYGAKGPLLGGYFAAKAAMDSLAQSYARELNLWGIETTIVQPGVFTKGTSHFTDAMKPGRKDVEKEYEDGPTKGVSEQNMEGTLGVAPDNADPQMVADAVVQVSETPRGQKPYRVTVDPVEDGARQAAAVSDRFGEDFYRRLGLEKLLKVSM